MSSISSELGISPVLLQAISQTLTSTEPENHSKFMNSNLLMERKSQKGVTHILDGMNEPVANLLQKSDVVDAKGDGKSEVRKLVKESCADLSSYVGATPLSMVNILTNLASQHLKAKNTSEVLPTQVKIESDVAQNSSSQQQVIIYYTNESSEVVPAGSEVVPAPNNDIVVGEMETGDELYQVVIDKDDTFERAEIVQPTEHQAKLIADHERQMKFEREDILTKRAQLLAKHEAYNNGDVPCTMMATVGQDPNAVEHLGTPCPICWDKISGYHYGIFTCESCKGFFKRTVQNKKTFVCHRQGECEISLFNRKKCPACRFAKCVQCGMKLQAIRTDRSRGGRSSYDGCSNHGRSNLSPQSKKMKRTASRPTANVESVSHLVAILNHATPASHQSGEDSAAQIPELLTDIMNLEPLLSDEDIPLDMIPDGFEENADSLYAYLTQLTELRLYKLVRWARNLPQFGAISTDDQILLLQNCWSELLALGVCWRSITTPGVLALSAGKTITLERAESLAFDDVVGRMISLADLLRRLSVDQYEYVAMKVLLLISPDVKGLKDPGKIMEQQDKLMDALLTYTSVHFPTIDNKFGEVLLRLAELSRISFIGKEQLLKRLPANLTTCGLLVELLKGENAAKDM